MQLIVPDADITGKDHFSCFGLFLFPLSMGRRRVTATVLSLLTLQRTSSFMPPVHDQQQRRIRSIRRIDSPGENTQPVITPNFLGNGTAFGDIMADSTSDARFFNSALPRLKIALNEFFAWTSWQVSRNARGESTREDLRREMSMRWRQLNTIARGDGSTITGVSNLDDELDALAVSEGATLSGGSAELDWGDIYFGEPSFEEAGNGGSSTMPDFQGFGDMQGLPPSSSPYLYGSPLDEEHLRLLDKLVSGGSLSFESAAQLLDKETVGGADKEEGEGEDDDEGVDSFELTDTVIAGKWRRRKRNSEAEIYFDSGA